MKTFEQKIHFHTNKSKQKLKFEIEALKIIKSIDALIHSINKTTLGLKFFYRKTKGIKTRKINLKILPSLIYIFAQLFAFG